MEFIDKVTNVYSDFNILFHDISKQSFKDFFYHKEIELYMQARKAVYYGDLDHLQRLKYQDLDMNQSDYDDSTLLHLATAMGWYKIVKFLIKNKVKVNVKNRWN
jgi:ankyrin repeat protein